MLSIRYFCFFDLFCFKKYISATGKAFILDPLKPSELAVSFNDKIPSRPNYIVLGKNFEKKNSIKLQNQLLFLIDTDYDQYTLIYSCYNSAGSNAKNESAFILARKPILDDTILTRLENVLKSLGVDLTKLITTDQTLC
jgi:lipocalin